MFSQTVTNFIEVHYALPPQATFVGRDEPMTSDESQAAREAICRTCPHLSPEEVELKCYEIHYGRARTEQLRGEMRRRRLWSEGYCVGNGR